MAEQITLADGTTPAAVTIGGMTADDFRAEARRAWDERAHSWETSDTDGFVSQAALEQIANQSQRNARYAEQGGLILETLFDIETGERIPATVFEGQYGIRYVWDGADGRIFFSPSAAKDPKRRAATNAKAGVRVGEGLYQASLNRRTGVVFPTGGDSMTNAVYLGEVA